MDNQVRVTTRFPKDIAEWLKAMAKDQSRSMNGQLVEVLKQAKREQANA